MTVGGAIEKVALPLSLGGFQALWVMGDVGRMN